MNEIKKHPYLISLIIVLALVNFIFVPLIDWQDSLIGEIRLKEKRLHRSEALVQSYPSYLHQLKQLQQLDDSVRQHYYPYTTESTFKLQIQSWIEQTVVGNGLSVQSVGWGRTKLREDTHSKVFSLNLKVRGKLGAFIALHQSLESTGLKLSFEEMRLNIKRASKTNLGNVEGNLKIKLYMFAGDEK